MKKGEQLVLGQLAVSKGFVEAKHLQEATAKTKGEENLIAYLVETKKLSKKNLSTILEHHKSIKEKKKQDKAFARYLLQNRIVDRHKLKQCFRHQEDLEKDGRYIPLSKIIVREYRVPKTQICDYKEENPQKEVQRTFKRACNLAKIYFNLGNNFLQSQNFVDAKKAYDRALKEDPNFIPARVNRGVTYLLMRDYEEAKKEFDQVIANDPSYTMGYYNKGTLLMLQSDPRSAYSEFTKAVKLNSKIASVWNNRSICLYLLKKWQKALLDIRKAKKYFPQCERIKKNTKIISSHP